MSKNWELLERDSLLPEGGRPKHLLWALDFMKVYPKQSSGCLAVSASVGAVDLNTHRKWVWAFIYAVANLVDVVVSLTHTVGTGAGVTLCYHVWVIWTHDAGVDGDHGSRCGRRALIQQIRVCQSMPGFSFQHLVLTPPAAAAPANADRLREQVGRAQRDQ